MKKVLVIFALLALAFSPVAGWSAGMSDDVTRDTTPGDPFELAVTPTIPGGVPTVIDPIATQEVFYAVRGADGVIYYTIQDVCPDNNNLCALGQAMRVVGNDENDAGLAPVSASGVAAIPVAFGPGTPQADFGGEFFAATNIVGALGAEDMGPGVNGDPVLSESSFGMGDADLDGWPGAGTDTPWVPVPTGQTANSDPDLHYMTSTYPNQWSGPAAIGAYLVSDPRRLTTPISPFDIIIEVRGDDGAIYRTAYNLNAVLIPPAISVPAIPLLSPGTGAGMAYVDRAFPSDVTGACNIGDGFPGCSDRFNPNTNDLINDSGQQQTPWVVIGS